MPCHAAACSASRPDRRSPPAGRTAREVRCRADPLPCPAPQTFAQPGPCSFLAPGQAFSGAQRMPGDSREEDWKVTVRIQVRRPRASPHSGRAGGQRRHGAPAQHCRRPLHLPRRALQPAPPPPLPPPPPPPCRCLIRPRASPRQGYDHARGTLCGVMEALNVPSSRTPVVTYWEGEVGGAWCCCRACLPSRRPAGLRCAGFIGALAPASAGAGDARRVVARHRCRF
jgi:hypothetical protein